MLRSHAVALTASVGRHGVNRPHDARALQALINEHLPSEIDRLAVDGVAGPLTIAAIEACERQFAKMQHADGRVDSHGRTLRLLNSIEAASHPHAPIRSPHPVAGNHHPAAAATPAHPAAASHPPLPAAPPRSAGNGAKAPATATHGYPAEVIAAAQSAQTKTRVPAAITLAQWALESGHGKHMPAGSNNPFGIKAAAGQPYVEARTREVVHGRSIYITARFRKFDSLADAFVKHGELLANGRLYAHARTLLPDDDRFADALTGVYATDPNYGTMLKSIMKSGDLYKYD